MTERPISPTSDIAGNQSRAGDPEASVWVEANAGSGKTHVLTERVLRLLLTGTAPENLLCLTYTKAAAAEMRRRVSQRLGTWAIAEEQELIDALSKLTGTTPASATLHRARTLFGHALETPGGLKINTIHAFAEAALHRFPLEAGVPFGFKVIEEAEQAELVRMARDAVLARGLNGDEATAEAVATLFDLLSDSQIESAIATALGRPAALRRLLADPASAQRRLRALLKVDKVQSTSTLRQKIIIETLFPPSDYAEVFTLCPPKQGGTRFEDLLALVNQAAPTPGSILRAFLTAKGEVPKKFPKKDLKPASTDLGDRLVAEAERLANIYTEITKAEMIARSDALLAVLGAVLQRYEAQKRARSLLDFDDLIGRFGDLLTHRAAREWVRYKLDSGITHILVDESQDTNPEQWQIVEALTEEFFSGDGAVERPRTIFAVGDQKQSIYSFQGADPALFPETGTRLSLKAGNADKRWDNVRLRASFRTLPVILDAVDKVFADPMIAAAVLSADRPVAHESARRDKGGSVTLWPPLQQEDLVLPADRWPLDSDAVELRNAARAVADRIATAIKTWCTDQRLLAQRGRAVTEDDVLILVQSRGPLFHEIIRALKRAELKSPGSDKLPVSNHIAVLDLLALGDILLNPADDLNLAALLRSPLFNINEDLLYEISEGRAKGVTLWEALAKAKAEPATEAYQRLAKWRGRLDFDRPFEFYANMLYAEGGLRRFHGRLGTEVDDVLAEFLDLALAHERSPQPSLQGFLAAMRQSDIFIKRELSETGAGVRVMTVHGAKGLEAPIVILADAATALSPQKLSKPVYMVDSAPGPLLIHANGTDAHTEQTLPFKEASADNERAEYWRKLYVGMTRAEDELYVTGMLTKTGKLDGTWYHAIENALKDEAVPVAIPGKDIEGLRYPKEMVEPAKLKSTPAQAAPTREVFAPTPLPKRGRTEIIRPSTAGAKDEIFATAARALGDAELARQRGIALHALLQHLSALPEADRTPIGLAAMPSLLPDHGDLYLGLVEKAVAILGNPRFADLFGPHSRSEIPFLAHATKGEAAKLIAGRVDRLMVTDTKVLAVDFKSDALPPSEEAAIPAAYITQLGFYRLVATRLFPHHQVECAILWTETEQLMRLDAEKLRAATKGFTLQ